MAADYGTNTGNEDREWTILVCPVCGSARLGPLPAWGSWCDGACSHPVTEMEPLRVNEARPLDIRGAEGATIEDFRGDDRHADTERPRIVGYRLRSWLYIWWREACFRGPQYANRRMFGYHFGRPA